MKTAMRRKLKSLIALVAAGYTTYGALSFYNGEENFYKNTIMPIIRRIDPESAHKFAVFTSKYRLIPKSQYKDPDSLKIQIFGRDFCNPVGIAAGFDKDGEAVYGLQDIGFGFVEIGSITPKPQPGNEKPRVFRLMEDEAVINRYGFNSEGHESVLSRIQNLKRDGKRPVILGINLGKNKHSSDPVEDYVEGIKKFGAVADYLVINISSPNTPGLRTMQNRDNLQALLKSLVQTRNDLPLAEKPCLLLKLAPDLSMKEKQEIADVLKRKECRVDGLIVSNTTIDRPSSLTSEWKAETGGLSGKPLKNMSTEMIRDMSRLTGGMPIIGVGGISSGDDAYEKIKAGASLVQLYTAMVYEGPPVVTKVKRELEQLLKEDGYTNVSDAVGKSN